jgi:NADH-quinone oxidoreductase subunit A
MLEGYFSILVFLVISTVICTFPILISLIVNKSKKIDESKKSPYEWGFEHFSDARMNFDVRYYLVAILFIIFDLEIAFLFPWAVAIDQIGISGLLSMVFFLFVLIIGFIYEWKKGALDWD